MFVEKDIVHRNLLYVLAKVAVLAREFPDLNIMGSSRFEGGVYVVPVTYTELEVVSVPVKPFVEDIVGEHVLCKDLVKFVLEREPRCRDDDMLLLLEVWKSQGVDINLNSVELSTMFAAESITRARRFVQNDMGLFLPTTVVVARRRHINEDLLRNHYGKVKCYEA